MLVGFHNRLLNIAKVYNIRKKLWNSLRKKKQISYNQFESRFDWFSGFKFWPITTSYWRRARLAPLRRSSSRGCSSTGRPCAARTGRFEFRSNCCGVRAWSLYSRPTAVAVVAPLSPYHSARNGSGSPSRRRRNGHGKKTVQKPIVVRWKRTAAEIISVRSLSSSRRRYAIRVFKRRVPSPDSEFFSFGTTSFSRRTGHPLRSAHRTPRHGSRAPAVRPSSRAHVCWPVAYGWSPLRRNGFTSSSPLCVSLLRRTPSVCTVSQWHGTHARSPVE